MSASGLQLTESALPENPDPGANGAMGAGQYGNGGGYGGGESHGLVHHLAFEAGGGFNAPVSNAVTYGGQLTVGGGLRFSPRFALLAEYQFLDAKLPGYLIAEAGANGGYAHLWSLTLDPVVSLFPKASNDVYVTGGGGFYRKVTSFTDPQEGEYCDYFYGCYGVTTNAVVGHFSSNQGGFNIGGGFQHRIGGMYGESHTSIFVEARYVDAFTPAVTTQPNGLGTTTVAADTKMIPVSFGVRW